MFHQTLIQNVAQNTTMAAIDRDLHISTNTVDPEVKQRWFSLALYVGYSAAYPPCEEWVKSQGNAKYIQSIAKACYASSGEGVFAMCQGWFNSMTSKYSPFTNDLVVSIFNS